MENIIRTLESASVFITALAAVVVLYFEWRRHRKANAENDTPLALGDCRTMVDSFSGARSVSLGHVHRVVSKVVGGQSQQLERGLHRDGVSPRTVERDGSDEGHGY